MSRKYAPNRIRELRKAAGLTMEELGAQMRDPVTLNTIAKLETSVMGLTLDYMVQIAEVLRAQPADLLEGGGTVRMVPILGAIAAGNWTEELAFAEDHLPVPSGIGGPRSFALRPEGESMNRIAAPGSYIVIDPDQTALLEGKHYAVRNGSGEATFKTYRAQPPRLEPCSTDPAFKPIQVGQVPFVVIGRVILVIAEI